MNSDKISNIMYTGLLVVLGIVLGALYVVGMSIIRAFVLIRLWAWFVVPIFNVSVLNYPYAIGLSLIIGLFMTGSKIEKNQKIWQTVLYILSPFLILFMGWIVKMFI